MTHKKNKTEKPLIINKGAVIMVLVFICIVAFIIRVVPPYKNVFGSGYVSYLETDAYCMMYNAQYIHDSSFIYGITYSMQNCLLFSWVVAMLGHIFTIEQVGSWLPPLLGIGTVILVYFIGRELFNKITGLLASLFTAVIPAEFLHRTLLGYADRHALEIFLMILSVYFAIKVIQTGIIKHRYTLWLGISLAAYMLNWPAGILMPGIILITALVIMLHGLIKKQYWRSQAAALSAPVLVLLAGYGIYKAIVGWTALTVSPVMVFSTLGDYFAPMSERYVSEMMPLLFPFGTFHLGVVWTNLHIFAVTFIIGLVFLWKDRTDRAKLFMLVWTIVIAIITLESRRFLYYFAIPVSLLSAYGIVVLSPIVSRFFIRIIRQIKVIYHVYFKKQKKYWPGPVTFGDGFRHACAVIVILMLFSLPQGRVVAGSGSWKIPDTFHEALVWLDQQPDNGKITAWWDYHHWVIYYTGRDIVYNNNEITNILFSTHYIDSYNLMAINHSGYLIIDRWLANKIPGLERVYGHKVDDIENTLYYKLASGKKVPLFNMVYSNPDIMIYKVLTDYGIIVPIE